VEQGSLSRTLEFDCGHGYAQEEYAMKRERDRVLANRPIAPMPQLATRVMGSK